MRDELGARCALDDVRTRSDPGSRAERPGDDRCCVGITRCSEVRGPAGLPLVRASCRWWTQQPWQTDVAMIRSCAGGRRPAETFGRTQPPPPNRGRGRVRQSRRQPPVDPAAMVQMPVAGDAGSLHRRRKARACLGSGHQFCSCPAPHGLSCLPRHPRGPRRCRSVGVRRSLRPSSLRAPPTSLQRPSLAHPNACRDDREQRRSSFLIAFPLVTPPHPLQDSVSGLWALRRPRRSRNLFDPCSCLMNPRRSSRRRLASDRRSVRCHGPVDPGVSRVRAGPVAG